MSVVLLFAAGANALAGADASELSARMTAGRRRVAGQLEAMTEERERLTRQGVLPPLAVATFRRGELRLDAELRWHQDSSARSAAGLPGRRAPMRAVGGNER